MKILLVRLRLVGDVVFTTPVIRALRRHYPRAHISYVVEASAAPVLRGNPDLNDLIVLPKSRGWARLRDDLAAARRLRAERFDLAIDLHGGPRGAWLTWSSRAPTRIGYTIAGRSWMYTHRVERARDLAPRHSVQNQWDLLAPLGIGACDPARDAVEMVEAPAATAKVERWLHAAGIDSSSPIIVIHASAGNPFRRWPAESFAALAATLAAADPRRRVILTSGPSDHGAAAAISRDARQRLGGADAAIIDADLDLGALHALISRAAVYIGGDSGPAHIASTTRTPIVELFGPTLPERSRPWRDPRWFAETVDAGPLPCRPCHQRQCEPGDFRCLTRITPERVAAAAERALSYTREMQSA